MRLRFWLALVLIILFAVTMNQLFFDSPSYLKKSKYFRNYLELVTVCITGLLGLIYFIKAGNSHLLFLWKFTYGLGILFLFVYTLIDNYIFSISKEGQYRFYTIKTVLTGPIVFFILFLLQRFVAASTQNKEH